MAELKENGDDSVHSIVVGMDFSPSSNRAVAFSSSLAKGLNAEVIAVFVKDVDDLAIAIRENISPVHIRHKQLLAKDVANYIHKKFQSISKTYGKNFTRIRLIVENGEPWRAILRVARRVKTPIILVGTRSRSPVKNLLLGSTARKLIEKSSYPVMVISTKRSRRKT
jgi:nucleotide-binding universal stress UspA family protein